MGTKRVNEQCDRSSNDGYYRNDLKLEEVSYEDRYINLKSISKSALSMSQDS